MDDTYELLALPWILRVMVVSAFMSSATACVWKARGIQPGFQRFLSTLPALAAMHCCPLLFNFNKEPISAMSAAFVCCRLTSGKVVAFALGRGALTLPLSLLQFASVLLAPFMPAEVATSTVLVKGASKGAVLSSDRRPSAAPQQCSAFKQDSMSLRGLVPLPVVWQRVSAYQRFSLDLSSHLSQHLSSSPSPLDSPRIAAVHQQQVEDQAAASAEPADGHQQQHQQQPPCDKLLPEQPHVKDPTSQQPQQATCSTSTSTSTAADPAAAHATTPRVPSKLSTGTHPSSNGSGGPGHRAVLSGSLLLNVAVCVGFLLYCLHSAAALHGVVCHLGAMAAMWWCMDLIMRASSHPARTLLGMTLAPHFINPFAATSLTDFWARRWNITQGLVLRYCVYEPIIQGCLVAPQAPRSSSVQHSQQGPQDTGPACQLGSTAACSKPPFLRLRRRSPLAASSPPATPPSNGLSTTPGTRTRTTQATQTRPELSLPATQAAVPRWRRQLAASATFVVSGLEHELFLWYLLRVWDHRWLVFFSMQGPLLAMEGWVKRWARSRGLKLHPFVSHLAVLLVLGLTTDAFFWPPITQPRILQPLTALMPGGILLGVGMA